ncbi:unnamed protein product [Linum tenue]|jgi:hypothetical protein
MKL